MKNKMIYVNANVLFKTHYTIPSSSLFVPENESMNRIWGWEQIQSLGARKIFSYTAVVCCYCYEDGHLFPHSWVSPSVNTCFLCWEVSRYIWQWAKVFCCGNNSFALSWSPLLFLIKDTYFCHTVRYFLGQRFM